MKFLASAALLLTVGALSLTVGALLVFATVIFALVLFFPLSLLGLVGVLAGLENRTGASARPGARSTEVARWPVSGGLS